MHDNSSKHGKILQSRFPNLGLSSIRVKNNALVSQGTISQVFKNILLILCTEMNTICCNFKRKKNVLKIEINNFVKKRCLTFCIKSNLRLNFTFQYYYKLNK